MGCGCGKNKTSRVKMAYKKKQKGNMKVVPLNKTPRKKIKLM